MGEAEHVHTRDLPDALRRVTEGVCGFEIELAMSGFSAPVRLSAGLHKIAGGKTQVRQYLLRMFAAFDGIDYDLAAAWVRREVVVLDADVRFARGDRACVQFPVTIVFRFSDDLISEVHLWTYSAGSIAVSNFPSRIPGVNGTSRVA